MFDFFVSGPGFPDSHPLNSFSRPVFDVNNDTFEALHERSPFAVNCIGMVAARVRDGGG